jgi:hypothetical protein
MAKLLCVGSFAYDLVHLATIARRAQERLGLDAVFASAAPAELGAQARDAVGALGFETFDGALAARDRRISRNPIERFRWLRDENRRLIDGVLEAIQPAAIVATVNPPPSLFLDHAAQRGVPSILLQLWFWGDRSFHRARHLDERRSAEATLSFRSRWRKRIERRVAGSFGFRPHILWDLHHAQLAAQGPAIQRRLVADGIPPGNVVATGNPLLDELAHLKQAPGPARERVRRQLRLAADVEVVTYLRSHEDRLFTVDRDSREDSQVQIIRALLEAAPEAQVVVKVHPREGEAEKAFIRSIDPRVLVVGEEVVTVELIAASAVAVGTASATLLQAVALDRPTVSAFFWSGPDYLRTATDWSAVDRVSNARALAESVRRHLDDPDYQAHWRARRAAFTADEFLLDGQGTERIVDLIDRLVRPREPAVVGRP